MPNTGRAGSSRGNSGSYTCSNVVPNLGNGSEQLPVLLSLACCSLQARGSRLLVLRGKPEEVLPRVFAVSGQACLQLVHWQQLQELVLIVLATGVLPLAAVTFSPVYLIVVLLERIGWMVLLRSSRAKHW